MGKKREVPNTNGASKTKKGNIYVMDFGEYEDGRRIVKLGISSNTSVRASQHKSGGNKYVKGREPKILINCGLSKYSQQRYEDKNREIWDNLPGFERCPRCNDTFFVDTTQVSEVFLVIKNKYTAQLIQCRATKMWLFFCVRAQ